MGKSKDAARVLAKHLRDCLQTGANRSDGMILVAQLHLAVLWIVLGRKKQAVTVLSEVIRLSLITQGKFEYPLDLLGWDVRRELLLHATHALAACVPVNSLDSFLLNTVVMRQLFQPNTFKNPTLVDSVVFAVSTQ